MLMNTEAPSGISAATALPMARFSGWASWRRSQPTRALPNVGASPLQ
jgi:hypothetical protein